MKPSNVNSALPFTGIGCARIYAFAGVCSSRKYLVWLGTGQVVVWQRHEINLPELAIQHVLCRICTLFAHVVCSDSLTPVVVEMIHASLAWATGTVRDRIRKLTGDAGRCVRPDGISCQDWRFGNERESARLHKSYPVRTRRIQWRDSCLASAAGHDQVVPGIHNQQPAHLC